MISNNMLYGDLIFKKTQKNMQSIYAIPQVLFIVKYLNIIISK